MKSQVLHILCGYMSGEFSIYCVVICLVSSPYTVWLCMVRLQGKLETDHSTLRSVIYNLHSELKQ